jgi:hypothetical protein
MKQLLRVTIAAPAFLCLIVSCGAVSRRMPDELDRMHDFLTKDDPQVCRNYHYNFEREAPRLYKDQLTDSILDIIDYIKTECGPTSELEVTRALVLIDRGQFNDSLIGSSTIPQMLRYRSREERLSDWGLWTLLYGSSEPVDNTHDRFAEFETGLAERAASDSESVAEARAIGLFYSGEFDSAFSYIQSEKLRGTALQNRYDQFAHEVKQKYRTRGNIALLMGNWSGASGGDVIGNHPELGLQLGGEGEHWRIDGTLSYRFVKTTREYLVSSGSNLLSTKHFDSWMVGLDVGYKFIDNGSISTDLFFGVGYDAIYSAPLSDDEWVTHSSAAFSVGLRHRIFMNARTGWYLGGILRYSVVDYANPGGSPLPGNTLTISLVTGWSYHATLKQFLEKLNYKGDWRS